MENPNFPNILCGLHFYIRIDTMDLGLCALGGSYRLLQKTIAVYSSNNNDTLEFNKVCADFPNNLQ